MARPFVRRASPALVAGLLAVGALASTATATPDRQTLTADLSPTAEASAAGPSPATGFASLAVDRDRKRVCTSLWVTDVDAPTGATVTLEAAGEAPSVVLTLETPTTGAIQDSCINEVDKSLLKALIDAPSDYWVTVSNAA